MATGNPFESVSFDQNQEEAIISNDDIVRVLKDMNPSLGQVQGGTQAGIERVNANMGKTGTFAFKDDKGQAVLTNVAIDATGQEKPIAALLRPAPASPNNPSFNYGGGDTRPALFQAFRKLQTAQTEEEAESIYSSLLESLTSEATRLEQEAYRFAENKFGISEITKQLNDARQADRTDPMYAPGMGDSPITQKIVDDLRLLSASASEDAKGFLRRNMTYNSLAALRTNAEREYTRIKKEAERTQNKEDTLAAARETADINRKAGQLIREEDRKARREEEAERVYNSLTPTQIQRITMLNAGDLASMDNEKSKRIKIADIAVGAIKDKKMQEAVSAESDEQLLGQALSGNGVAKKLVVMEEATRTGRSVQEVEDMLRSLTLRMGDQRLAIEVLNRQKGMTSQERGERLAMLNPAMYDLNPNRKVQADALRVQLVLQDAKYKIQQQYMNDVSSWGSAEPTLLAAIDKSKKTTGKVDIRNVAAAYIGDAVAEERKARLAEFNKLMKNAALKQKDSMFGAPNWREGEKVLTETLVDLGLFAGTLQAIHNKIIGGPESQGRSGIAQGRQGPFAAMIEWAGRGIDTMLPPGQ